MTRFRFQSMPRNRGTTPGDEAANAIARCLVCGGCGPGCFLLSSNARERGNSDATLVRYRKLRRSARLCAVAAGGTPGVTVLSGQSGITLVKVVPVLTVQRVARSSRARSLGEGRKPR